ncbi:MAG: IPT/TIG domain-containing protein [Patescibacteria group bacterium]
MSQNKLSSKFLKLTSGSIIIVALVVVCWPVVASAQTAGGLTNFAGETSLGTQVELISTVARIINIVLGILGVIAIGIILYGGFLWLSSRGNQEQIAKAKKVLANGLIGLVIILTSFAIASFVFGKLYEATGGPNACAVPPCNPPPPNFGSDYLKTKWVQPTRENVKLCFAPQAGFNYEVKSSSPVNQDTFRVEDEAGNLFYDAAFDSYYPGAADPNDDVISFTHQDHEFAENTIYTVTLQSLTGYDPLRAKDIFSKVPLIKRWSFKTGTESDNTAPEVVLPTQPKTNETDVCRKTPIQVEFNEPMLTTSFKVNDPAATVKLEKINGWNGAVLSNITLTDPSFGHDLQIVTVAATTTLEENAFYKVTLIGGINGIKDACSIPLENDYVWEFQTGTTINCEPTITDVAPMKGDYSDHISVKGTNFFKDGEVYFNDFASGNSSFDGESNILCWNSTSRDNVTACANNEIIVRVPVGATTGPAYDQDGYTVSTGPIQVKVDRFWSNKWTGFIIGSPFIGELSPGRGGVGQYLTISGWNFGNAEGVVYFIDSNGNQVVAEQPLGCDDWWQETEIVVKVPAVLAGQFYEVQVVTALGGTNAGNKPSNTEYFNVTADPPGPGICELNPVSEDILNLPVDITVKGERFGAAPGKLTFETIEATKFNLPDYKWTAGEIMSQTPLVTGVNALGKGDWRVRVTSGGKTSNFKKFRVTDITGVTDNRPPEVVDYQLCSANTQSPSPYYNTENACTNALVSARFTEVMDETTIDLNAIELQKCNNTVNFDPLACAIVVLNNLEYLRNSINQVIGFTVKPVPALESNYWYEATIKNTVTSLVGLSMVADYTWHWRVGPGVCPVNKVILSPSSANLAAVGDTQDFNANAIATNCNILEPASLTWAWDYGNDPVSDPPPPDRIEINQAVAPNPNANKLSITALAETVNGPAFVNAETENKKSDDADVYVGGGLGGGGCAAAGPPVITDMKPVNGRAESKVTTVVTITGRNFDCSGSVYFGSVKAVQAMCGSWGPNTIVVAAPVLAAGQHNVSVETRLGLSTTATDADAIQPIFTANNIIRPGICSLMPNRGPEGTRVSIKGYNFTDTPPPTPVNFNTSAVFFPKLGTLSHVIHDYTKWSNKEIVFNVPPPRSGKAWVQVDYGAAGGGLRKSNEVDYYGNPYITDIIPSTGPAGTWVTIRGGNFGDCLNLGVAVGQLCTVAFTDSSGAETLSDPLPSACLAEDIWTDREIIVKVPDFGGTQFDSTVTVYNDDPPALSVTADKKFDYNPNLPLAPGLCSLAPDTVKPAGLLPEPALPEPITLKGDGFSAINRQINFSNKTNLIPVNWIDDAQASVTAPNDTESGDVTVQKIVTIKVEKCNGVMIGGICIGFWSEENNDVTVISNPKYFTVGTTTTTPGDLRVTDFVPLDGDTNICRNTALSAVFNKLVDKNSISSTNVRLIGSFNNLVSNSSFENVLGIEWDTPVCASRSNIRANSGSWSLNPCMIPTTQIVNGLTVGKKYQASVYWWAQGNVDFSVVDQNGEIAKVNDNGAVNEWRRLELSFVAASETVTLELIEYAGNAFFDDVELILYPEVVGSIKLVNDNTGISKLNFVPNEPLEGNTLYRFRLGNDLKGKDSSLINCTMAPGCEVSFTTGSYICQLAQVTITPPQRLFRKVSESQDFEAKALAPDGKELAANFTWQEKDTANVITVTSPLDTSIVSVEPTVTLAEPNGKNGQATMTVTANAGVAGTKSASAEVEVFICEDPFIYQDSDYNFEFKYCVAKVLGGLTLPRLSAPVVRDLVINPESNDPDLLKEILFNVEDAEDIIGLRIYTNLNRLTPADWLKNKPQGSSATISSFTIDGYEAGQGGQTVYITAPNVTAGGNIWLNEYLLSYNTNARADSQTIYNELKNSWQFNTNLASVTSKQQMRADLQRLTDLNTMREIFDRYAVLHNYTVPQLPAGSYVPGFSTSKWNSWQQTLSSTLGRNLPKDPINKLVNCEGNVGATCADNADCDSGNCKADSTCSSTGYDAQTCWNEQTKDFLCPAGSYIYRYRVMDQQTARLYFTAEFDNGGLGVTWKGSPEITVPTLPIDANDQCQAIQPQVWQEVKYKDPPLTINRTGSGLVASQDLKINCGGACNAIYNEGEEVKLTATPAAGFHFNSWSGDCILPVVGTNCTVQMAGDQEVGALFSASTYTLSITKDGEGTVLSDPAGIDCSDNCTSTSASYTGGPWVTLTATPELGYVFAGWGGSCMGTGDCAVIMGSNKTVGAKFLPVETLSVTKVGTGSVMSLPAGINCGADCDYDYVEDTSVTLTAVAGVGFQFTGWEVNGSDTVCSDIGSCIVIMDDAKAVKATFEVVIVNYKLTVVRSGTGTGLVTGGAPAGIDCGADCNEIYQEGTNISLIASAGIGSEFTGWLVNGQDAVCPGLGDCSLTMDGVKTVTASFKPKEFELEVSIIGTSGRVTSDPIGIDCDNNVGDCTKNFIYGQTITLTPIAVNPNVFVGWGGDVNCGGVGICTITMTKDLVVTAKFDQVYKLALEKAGDGSGKVTSNPLGRSGGIDCGDTCEDEFIVDDSLTLVASAYAGSEFAGWKVKVNNIVVAACGLPLLGDCDLQPNNTNPVTVEATFNHVNVSYQLKVIPAGSGKGVVTSDPSGIDCGNGQLSCIAFYKEDTVITLTAAPAGGSVFTSWSGDTTCGANNPCQLTMNGKKEVTATFTASNFSLTVVNAGGGLVTSDVPGISCQPTCNASYASGSMVTLTAQQNLGYTFDGWQGSGCFGIGLCQINIINNNKTVAALFSQNTYTLNVEKLGLGSGTIKSDDTRVDMNCNPNCGIVSLVYVGNSNVILTATALPGSNFTGWQNCTSNPAPNSCQVTMSSNKTVKATFDIAAPVTHTLTVNPPPVNGTITGAGINCPGDCTETTAAPSIALTANPAAGYKLKQWLGDAAACGANPNCTVQLTIDKTVSAEFEVAVVTHTYSMVAGWNFISLPFEVADGTWNVLFPTAIDKPQKFYNSKYTQVDNLEVGFAYFIKFNNDQNVTIAAAATISDFSLPMAAGTSGFGSLSTSVPISAITFTPGIIGNLKYFDLSTGGFVGGVTQIDPGVGYTGNASEAGTLTITK